MKKNIKTLAALLMAGAAFTACSSSDDNIIEQTQNPTEPKVYTLVIKASKGGDATTRALKPGYDEEESKNTVDAYWTGTEKIEVGQYNSSTYEYKKIGEATADPSPDGETIITATLNDDFDPDNDLNFYLGGHTLDYTGQVGLLTGTNSISEKYDYATDCLYSGSFTVDDINNQVIPNNNNSEILTFGGARQAIIKFTLKDKANNEAISPSAFTVSDGTSTVSLTDIPATTYSNSNNGDGVLYVAFPASGYDRTITLTATVGDDTYTYTTSSAKTFWCGEYYEITVKMTKQAPAAKALADATAEDLGRIIGADGNIYDNATAATAAGTTAEALICYVGDAGSADASSDTYKGLALALTDASTSATWCSLPFYYAEICLGTQYGDAPSARNDIAGIANTNALVGHASHTHAAATLARNYKSGTHPTGTSAWFLPSAGQWDKMVNACKNVLGTNNSFKDLRDGFNGVGGTNLQSNYYWSSTELSFEKAWGIMFDDEHGGYGLSTYKDKGLYVRSALAF